MVKVPLVLAISKGNKNTEIMLVCWFIVVWLLWALKLLQFPSFFCKNADFYTKNGRVNFRAFWGLPEQNYEVFFCLLWQFGLFLANFTHKLHSGCLFLANEITANFKSTSRLKFKSTGLECIDANKTSTICVELKGKFFPAHKTFAETESVSCFMIYALAACQLEVLLSVTPKTACLLQTKAQSTSQTFCLQLVLCLLNSFVRFGWKKSSR